MKFTQIEHATSDDRGYISDIVYKNVYEHMAIIETPNASVNYPVIRGNHYHKQSTQAIFIVTGGLRYWYVEPHDPEIKYIDITSYGLVETPPYEVHTLEIRIPTVFIAMSKGLRGGEDYEADTFRIPHIIPNYV